MCGDVVVDSNLGWWCGRYGHQNSWRVMLEEGIVSVTRSLFESVLKVS